ncbi:MAG TPA: DUF4156 domain-containing protein [Bdellovibrionales bacterium]|nr:DUF4156 domain-containing protein [Bdellovibrionales bacterium]
MRLTAMIAMALLATACASRSVTPDANEVKVSREAPSGDCQDLGRITGTSSTRKATNEQLLEDLKQDAAKKGANFVKVEEYSSLGTMVTGTAYLCP